MERPFAEAVYGLQKGTGNNYETLQKQTAGPGDLVFEFDLPLKQDKEGRMGLYGPIVQGPPQNRFFYLDIGSYAGQHDAPVSGRLKIPLPGIDGAFAEAAANGRVLFTRIRGTNEKDGRATTGTIKPFDGWKVEGGR